MPVETIYLHDIAVKPEARKLGAGGHLLAAVEKLAATVGAPTITLTAVAGAWYVRAADVSFQLRTH